MKYGIRIYTERNYVNMTSRDTVYEWEDDFAAFFKTDLCPMPYPRNHPFAAFPRRLNLFRPIPYKPGKTKKVFFCMNAYLLKYVCWVDSNVIPVILDPYEKELDDIYTLTKKLPIYYMTCLEMCHRLKAKHPDSKVHYIPQCVAMKYCGEQTCEKTIDVIQFGRMDPVLHGFMMEYCEENPGVNYVYRSGNKDIGFQYISTCFGEIAFPESRESFIHLLRSAKICLMSTPLMDKSRDFGEGVDFFTARWYEAPAMRCHLVGRYSENEESEQLGISRLCPNVSDYCDFKQQLDSILKFGKEYDDCIRTDYLNQNNSFSRAEKIRRDFEESHIL